MCVTGLAEENKLIQKLKIFKKNSKFLTKLKKFGQRGNIEFKAGIYSLSIIDPVPLHKSMLQCWPNTEKCHK